MPVSDRADPGGVTFAGARQGWWLEDAVPGTTIQHPRGRTLVEGDHLWLAWVTHNVSGVHGNADAASRTEWGRPVVLGALTVAIVVGLAAPADGPPETVARTWSVGWHSISLERAVVAGDTIRAESVIEGISRHREGRYGRVTRTIIGRNQRGEVVVRIHEERTVLKRSAPPTTAV